MSVYTHSDCSTMKTPRGSMLHVDTSGPLSTFGENADTLIAEYPKYSGEKRSEAFLKLAKGYAAAHRTCTLSELLGQSQGSSRPSHRRQRSFAHGPTLGTDTDGAVRRASTGVAGSREVAATTEDSQILLVEGLTKAAKHISEAYPDLSGDIPFPSEVQQSLPAGVLSHTQFLFESSQTIGHIKDCADRRALKTMFTIVRYDLYSRWNELAGNDAALQEAEQTASSNEAFRGEEVGTDVGNTCSADQSNGSVNPGSTFASSDSGNDRTRKALPRPAPSSFATTPSHTVSSSHMSGPSRCWTSGTDSTLTRGSGFVGPLI